MKYDYLIVGSGLFGSVFAREMTDAGKKCLVIESRSHPGGNVYSENHEGIEVHVYGPHIFHTNSKEIWEYVQKFAEFNSYSHRPKVRYGNDLYSFPLNLLTFHQLWGVKNPVEAREKLESVKVKIENPQNLEEHVLSQVGEEIYEKFIKGYTKKQWQRDPRKLPASIIKRLPIRLNFDDSYYFDKYQGCPVGGYTNMIKRMLDGIEVKFETDYLVDKEYWNSTAKKVVFTGKIDEFYGYKFGELEYRSLEFETEHLSGDFQGTSQVNYTEEKYPFTRVIEHKHFEPENLKKNEERTIITKEYSKEYKRGDVPYYPINDERNSSLYYQYKNLADKESHFIFGGRLAEYKYYDMHQVIGSALSKARRELENEKE